MLGGDNYSMIEGPMAMERSTGKWRCTNTTESAPNCPRCASSNTKFCYYNNYSLSQPRYFCKGCRRYWTKGGSLRNVPVGGGCRKSRRARASRPNNYPPQTLGQRGASETGGGGGATDIDLAAVFAKYVSQNVGENDVSGSPGGSSGSSENIPAGVSEAEIDCQYLDDVTMLEYQTPLDLVNGGEDRMLPGISAVEEAGMMNGQDFVFEDCSGYDLLQQGVGGDDLGIPWSDEATNLSNYEWQQQTMMQMEDLGNFFSQDHFTDSANASTENWGFFDLSAYQYFSRP